MIRETRHLETKNHTMRIGNVRKVCANRIGGHSPIPDSAGALID
jgi:hypothetical protein